jgi:hypothetical protein
MRPIYSPSTPSDSSWIPERNVTEMISDAKPGTSIP